MPDKYGVQSWEQMVTQVVVHGRPENVRSAAAGWELALRNLNSVKASLDDNVKDLGATWSGEAYESFQAHIGRISERIQAVADEANNMGTVVGTLRESADRLHAAQAEIPIPAGLEDEVAAARNQDQGVPDGIFEAAAVGMLGLPFGPIGVAAATGLGALLSATGAFDALSDWLNDRTDEARVIWNRLNSEIESEAVQTPPGVTSSAPVRGGISNDAPLNVGGPSTDLGALTGGGGVAGAAPALSADAPAVGNVAPPGTGGFDPATSGAPSPGTTGGTPSLGSGSAGFDPGAATPGTGSFDPDALGAQTPGGTGLAGAGGLGSPSAGGLGAGGLSGLGTGGAGTGALGAGGLGSSGGVGAGGGGLGGAPIGGGALGKPVSPAQAGIPGVGALGAGAGAGAGAGRGTGKGAAGTTGRPSLPGGTTGSAAGGRPGTPGLVGAGGVGAGNGAGFGNEDEHSTWLTEDDDVWGGNGTASSGVLR